MQFPPMTMARGGLSTAVVDRSIYAIGGTEQKTRHGQGDILDTVEYADISRAQWIQVSHLASTQLCGLGSAVCTQPAVVKERLPAHRECLGSACTGKLNSTGEGQSLQ